MPHAQAGFFKEVRTPDVQQVPIPSAPSGSGDDRESGVYQGGQYSGVVQWHYDKR